MSEIPTLTIFGQAATPEQVFVHHMRMNATFVLSFLQPHLSLGEAAALLHGLANDLEAVDPGERSEMVIPVNQLHSGSGR